MSCTLKTPPARPSAARRNRSRTADRHARFVAELVRNGGNASAAARAVGYHPDHGRRLVSQNATISATLEELKERTEEEIREWTELAPQAQQVLLGLLDSDDDRVRFMAAVHIIDRALGKVPQKVEQRVEHQSTLTEIQVQCALSLMSAHRLPYVEAEAYVLEHPGEVQTWAREHVAAPTNHNSQALQIGAGAAGDRRGT